MSSLKISSKLIMCYFILVINVYRHRMTKNTTTILLVLTLMMTICIVSAITPFTLKDGNYYTSDDCNFSSGTYYAGRISRGECVDLCKGDCTHFVTFPYTNNPTLRFCKLYKGAPKVVATNKPSSTDYFSKTSCGLMKNGDGVDAEVKRINDAISTKPLGVEQWDYNESKDVYSKVGCSFSFKSAVQPKTITVDSTEECRRQCAIEDGVEEGTCSHFNVIQSGNVYTCKMFYLYKVKDGADNVTYSSTNKALTCGLFERRITSQLLPL